jgi:hypothetical protein
LKRSSKAIWSSPASNVVYVTSCWNVKVYSYESYNYVKRN